MEKDDNNYTKEAYESNGRYQIHPLSAEGYEAYLSKDSYNYHYLKNKWDPEILRQVQEDMEKEKKQKLLELRQKEQARVENMGPKINEPSPTTNNYNNLPEDEPKVPTNIKKNNVAPAGNKNKAAPKKPGNGVKSKGVGVGNKGNKPKIGMTGGIKGPIISNVKDSRGNLKNYPLPYQK